MKVSVIVPCFNAAGKIEKCLESLRTQDFPVEWHEVIFVDDCSSDGTYEYLIEEASKQPNWRVARTESNSGSPSRPRNIGIEAAQGDYVFFLDCDDVIYPDTLRKHHAEAEDRRLSLLRGYLMVDDGVSRKAMNRVQGFDEAKGKNAQIEAIIRHQSTTVASLIRRDLLLANGIRWEEAIRTGEDTIFLLEVLRASERIGYIDHPTFVYNKAASRVASTTRSYGARDLTDHLQVWARAEAILQDLGLSFMRIRFQVSLQTVLTSLIRYNRGDIDRRLFGEFSAFVRKHWHIVSDFGLNARLKALTDLLHDNDYDGFFEEAKPRLLVAGYDLKFVDRILAPLSTRFQIRVDEWTGHNTHDEERSKRMLEWAEVILCEWLLGNAVWYSKHKRPGQKLIVRMHRFELSRTFGKQVVEENVDAYIAVSVLYFERLAEVFNIDRAKIRLLPNYIDVDAYERSGDADRVFNIALIGSLPSRKGLMRALTLLRDLLAVDSRYNLSVYGRAPAETPWIRGDAVESRYFAECDRFVEENGLESHVRYMGHVDVTTALSGVGFVLSVSDDEWLPESFHIAPADGFAAGGQGLFLRWSGVEYIYPREYVFDSLQALRDYILANQSRSSFLNGAAQGRGFVQENYSSNLFLQRLNGIVRDLL